MWVVPITEDQIQRAGLFKSKTIKLFIVQGLKRGDVSNKYRHSANRDWLDLLLDWFGWVVRNVCNGRIRMCHVTYL